MNGVYSSTMLRHLELYKHNCFPPVDHCHTLSEAALLTEDFWSQGQTSQHVQQCTSGSAHLSGPLSSPPLWSPRSRRWLHRGSGGRSTEARSVSAAAAHCSWSFWRNTHMPVMFSSLGHSRLFSCWDVIYLVSVSSQFTSIPCENMNQLYLLHI